MKKKILNLYIVKKILSIIPDKIYLKIVFLIKMGYKLNLKNPITFNEKLQWLKLYDRRDIYSKMVDKFDVKKLVSEIIGDEYIIPTLGVWNSFNEINFDDLPDKFVLKCTHDSGGVVICKDKKSFDIDKARKKINESLNTNYYYLWREWPYKNVKPRIIAEELLEYNDEKSLPDFKIFCFNGEAKFLFVAVDRPYSTKFNFYDMNFDRLPFSQHYPNFDYDIKKPRNFKKMVDLAEKLSKEFPHCRIDFYNINGKIYFGEMTFYHFSGIERFNPNKWDKIIGDYLVLPNKNFKE